MKLGLMMPCYKRRDVLEAVARYYAEMEVDGVEFERVAVVSNAEDAEVLAAYGWKRLYAPNTPLSEKHNAGMRFFYFNPVDAAMHLNSDDFITPAYFAEIPAILEREYDCVRLTDATYYDIPTGRMAFCSPVLPGSGTVLRYDLLRRLDFKPWGFEGISRHLDGRLFKRLRWKNATERRITVDVDDPVQLLGVKGDLNMWGYDKMIERIKMVFQIEPGPYLEKHFGNALDLESNALFCEAHEHSH